MRLANSSTAGGHPDVQELAPGVRRALPSFKVDVVF